jgi:hypothetical protein
MTTILDLCWFGHRRIRCWRKGHVFTEYTSPELCLWCFTQRPPKETP